ncbi:AAA family ATPase [candidate division KSB1 bacterium]|nr:AAA family ATPase [candidate division KSB1 bacterium]
MIIGLTGTNAAGKTTLLNYLISKNFQAFSLSDVIRDELVRLKLEPTRQNLIDVGNQLREQCSASVLADKIKAKISTNNAMIDSIRNTAEVRSLRCLNNFYLIAIDAPVEERFQRAKKRGRTENAATLDEFIKIENKEKNENENHQNIPACLAVADYTIKNEKDVDHLYENIENILDELQKRTRPDWEEYFLKMAFLVAERSTCNRHHVGAIIVKGRHVLTTGYNGAARKTDDCLKLGCLRDQLKIPSGERHEICRAIHAEQNAIIQAGVHGVNIEGTTIYCTHSPCIICAKMIVNAGIKEIITCDDYPDEFNLVLDLFNQAGIALKKIKRPGMQINYHP